MRAQATRTRARSDSAAFCLSMAGKLGLGLKHDVDVTAFAAFYELGGGAPIAGYFKVAHAAKDSENLARSSLCVSVSDLRDLLLANHNLERTLLHAENHGRILRRDVGDEIAEAVYLKNYTSQCAVVDRLRTGRREAHKVANLLAHPRRFDAFGQIRGNGRENISRVKCIADWLQEIVLGSNVTYAETLLAIIDQ